MSSITPINLRVEFAFGADRDAFPGTWTWTDLTNRTTAGSRVRLYDQEITIQKGSANESSQAQPTTISFTLNDFDGATVPTNAESVFYPNVVRGTPVRFRAHGGPSHLQLPGVTGAYASTPDAASLDITGDIFIAIDVQLYTGREPQSPMWILNKWGAAGQRSFRSYINTDGLWRFAWSADGTNNADDEGNLVPLPITLSGRALWGFHLDVDNGASGRTLTWYTSESGTIAGPWAIHEQRTDTGTTSIFASTTPLEIGAGTSPGTAQTNTVMFCGEVNAVEIRSGGTGGTVVANPNFTIQDENDTSFDDTAAVPKTWTINGASVIEKWHTRFLGEVSSIAPRWPSGHLANNAEVDIQASGAIRRLAQGAKPIQSALYRAITSTRNVPNIIAYWPFEDGSDTTRIGTTAQLVSPTSDVQPMNATGDFQLGADSTLPASKPLMTVPNGSRVFCQAPIPAIPNVPGVDWEVTRFVRIDDPVISPASPTIVLNVKANGRVNTWRVGVDDTQIAIVGLDDNGVGVVLDTMSVLAINFDQWVMYVLEVDDDGANVDWSLSVIYLPQGTFTSMSGTFVGDTGVPVEYRNTTIAPPSGVSLGHLIVTTGKNIGWLARADNGYDGEPATQRIRRICDEEGIPAWIDGPYNDDFVEWPNIIDDGVIPMGSQPQATVLEIIQDCAAADGGVFTEARHNLGLAYRARLKLYNQTTQLTWDASARGVIDPFDPTLDDQQIRNDVTVTRTDGSSYRAVDQTSIDTEGLYDTEIDLPIWRDHPFVENIASWLLHLGTWPGMRYPSVALEMDFADDLVDDWVGMVLGDRVTVTGLPSGHPTDEVDQIMDGYSEMISQFDWKIDLVGRPFGMFQVGEIGDDELGRMDTESSVLYASATATATGLSVATATSFHTSCPWTTSSGEFPFDVNVGGERVTVTDIDDIVLAFGSTGTASHSTNGASVVPSLPDSTTTGNLLLVFAAIRNLGTGTVNAITGYYRMPVFAEDSNVAVFGKIATASETSPTVSFTGGVTNVDTSAQMVRFTGTFRDVSVTPHRWGTVGPFAATQNVPTPAIQVGYANSLVLYLGWKSDDWTSVTSPGTEIGEPDTTTGDDQGIVWSYTIQTTATDVAATSFAVTGGATATVVGGVLVLRPDVQTFTVTRSVNDVSKAQTAGTDVRLWIPWTIAL